MCKPVFLALLFCTTFSAFASDPNPHWLQVQTPHFTVITDSNERQGRRIATQFEQMRAFFHTILPHAADDATPILVLALKDNKGFQALEPEAYLARGQLNLAGYFLRTQDTNFILLRLDAEGEHPFATVYHEYTHFMVRKAEWLPLWLNEGLAEFYQNTDIRDKDVLLGQASENDILYLRQNRLLPLTTLLTVDHNSPYYHEENKGSVFYAESWALTHFLEVNDKQNNTDRIKQYAQLLIQGKDSVSAAQQAFGDLKKLQSQLDSYVGQASFGAFKMNVSFPVDTASFQLKPISEPQANAIRARVLIDNNRRKDALNLLNAALRDEPENALAHETMGYLMFRDQEFTQARKWYGEALKLDPHSLLANYYYGAISLRTGSREYDAETESSLRAAIAINPAFAPSYDTLAAFYGIRNEKLDEAHLLNIQAVQLEPENLDYRLNTANVLSQQRKYIGAIGVLKATLPIAKTSGQTEFINNRIQQLQQFQAALVQAAIDKPVTPARSAPSSSSNNLSSSASSENSAIVPTGKTMVFRRVNGKIIGSAEDDLKYPAGDSKGPQHTVKGILRAIRCSYPNVLALDVDQGGKVITLYSNNYYKIVFTTAYDFNDEIKPCTAIEDMKASVKYAEVTDKNVAGQILAIELSK
jgi:tetratricopeptide (TPR) repeat protein